MNVLMIENSKEKLEKTATELLNRLNRLIEKGQIFTPDGHRIADSLSYLISWEIHQIKTENGLKTILERLTAFEKEIDVLLQNKMNFESDKRTHTDW